MPFLVRLVPSGTSRRIYGDMCKAGVLWINFFYISANNISIYSLLLLFLH
jgi:hypothetical protein